MIQCHSFVQTSSEMNKIDHTSVRGIAKAVIAFAFSESFALTFDRSLTKHLAAKLQKYPRNC